MMGKAILVLDKIPDKCRECILVDNREFYSAETSRWERWECRKTCRAVNIYSDTKPEWCPLKEEPERMFTWHDEDDYAVGYNDCIDNIFNGV